MKKRIIISFLGLVIMAILPFISVGKIFPENEIPQSSMQKKNIDTNKFLVLDTSSNKIISIDDREFCIGAVAFEMPASFEEEALKAQCIACYTHFSKLRENSKEKYDFSADLSNGEFYRKDISDESRQKISSAVDSVFGQVLTDSDGKLIDVAYHAISSGQTESAKDIFGFESEFLQPVSSAGDVNVSGYLSQKEVSADRFKEIMLGENIKLSGEPETWLGESDRTQSGTVKAIKICDTSISGAKMRELFDLRSANFDIEYSKNKFILTVYGYGHGVGMSQYGADSMAKHGADYKEILHHYYGNCNIKTV